MPLLFLGASIAVAATVYAAWSVHARVGSLTLASDDSYIYSGYVKMAFTPGAGLFSYNVGEHSAGTTGIAHYYAQVLALLPWFAVARRPPLPGHLESLSWIIAGACAMLAALLLTRAVVGMCGAVGVVARRLQAAAVAATVGLAHAHPAHVWGLFSGMENPLAALTVSWLATWCLSPARPAVPLALAAALLSATRPEWIPLAALMPGLGVLSARSSPRRWRELGLAYAVFAGAMLAMFLPLRFLTGQWQPEAFGARAHLSLRRLMSPDWAGLVTVFSRHWTVLLLASASAAAWAARRERSFRGGLAVPVTLLLFFVMRGMFKLTDFNVHDRYVSYLWPAMVVAAAPALAIALARGRARFEHAGPSTGARRLGIALPALAGVCALGGGLQYGAGLLVRDGREMLQVVKEPSLWMAANLTAHSIVCTEPAGAIRTFTDFVLVDRTGLTTRHYDAFKRRGLGDPHRDYCEYLRVFDVDYVFDYPAFLPDRCAALQTLRSWEPAPHWQSGGRIEVMRLLRPNADH